MVRRLRAIWRAIDDAIPRTLSPICPICGRVLYIKAMPLHLEFEHRPDDPEVIAWRERGAPDHRGRTREERLS